MRLSLALLLLVLAASGARSVAAQTLTVVRVDGDSLVLGADALAALPVASARVRVHDGPERTYAGPRLADVLIAAGVRVDSLRGAGLARVAVVEASDGYRVAFALGELAPGLGGSPALLALTVDGAPLGDDGPLRLVIEGDGRAARWARNVVRVRIVEAAR
ncbi:MAG TPA: hypothetical protein VK610_06030 [Rhodothermales bacterium]|nr:hypothetical protein [Rhodothermales bacterium]